MRRVLPLLLLCSGAFATPRQAPDLSISGAPQIALPGLPAALPAAGAIAPQEAASPSLAAVPVAAAPLEAPKTPLAAVREMAAARRPEATAALRFDGLKAPAPDLGTPEPEPPAAPRASGLKRAARVLRAALNGAPGSRRHWLIQSAGVGIALGAAAPALWKAAPFETLLLSIPAAVILGLGVALAAAAMAGLARRARSAKPAVLPSRRAKLALAAAGLALGMALAAVPAHFEGPLVERAGAVYAPAYAARYAGPAIGARMETLLAQNSVGRGILDGLRDRGATVRMPAFFIVATQDGSTAFHSGAVDAVFIDRSEVTGRGWTVDEFVRRPDLQAKLAYELQDVLAHELVHAGQARRSILEPNHFKKSFTNEEEAYLVEHFYEHARLEADPHAAIPAEDLGEYEAILDGVNGYFDSFRGFGAYQSDVEAPTPTYLAFRARVDAGWKAHRVEGYKLLAEHYANIPILRDRLEKKAAQAALP